jgi:phospholipid transport system substrate-binding protein
MTRTRRFLLYTLLLPAFASMVFAAGTPADPAQMLRGAVDEVLQQAYPEKPATERLSVTVRPVLEKYFAFDLIAKSAVGPTWKDFSAEQQKRITELLTELVIRSYADKFEPGDRPKITYAKPVEIDATRRELPSTITYAGKNYAVAYKVRLITEAWRIYDVNIEGISMVSNYRSQFDSLAQKGGATAIIAALEKNLAEVASK